MEKYKTYEKYKPLTVDWLGEVPEHWDARKLKFISSLNMGQSTDSSDYNYDGEGVPFLGSTDPIMRMFVANILVE
jgi:type I restriction enzyme S subunit